MSAENKKVPMSDNGKEEKINKVTSFPWQAV